MIWAILSVLSGLGDAICFAAMKKISNLDEHLILALRYFIPVPILFLLLFYYDVPKVSLYFYFIVFVNVAITLAAMFLMIKSFKSTDLSISIPMLSFSPIFLLFTSYILLNELPSLAGFIGIVVVVIGSYVLNLSSISVGYLEPFKIMLKNRGIFYMIIVAFLYSFTATISKIGIRLSNPAYFVLMNYLIASVILFALFFNKLKRNLHAVNNLKYAKPVFILGVSAAFTEFTYAIAVNFAIVPYIISLKRTSVIFSVLIGIFLFKEKNFREKISGALIMIIGAAMILLS